MNNIETGEKAFQLIEDYEQDLGHQSDFTLDIWIELMVDFAKSMCELQKEEVVTVMEKVIYQDRIGDLSYESVEQSILNTKNICDE